MREGGREEAADNELVRGVSGSSKINRFYWQAEKHFLNDVTISNIRRGGGGARGGINKKSQKVVGGRGINKKQKAIPGTSSDHIFSKRVSTS